MPTQIPALTALTDPQGADDLLIRDDSAGSDKKIALSDLLAFIASPEVIETADTTRTISASDIGKVIVFSANDPISVTFPEDATEDLPIGASGVLIPEGTGQIKGFTEGTDTFLTIATANVTVDTGAPMVWRKIRSGVYFLGGAIV